MQNYSERFGDIVVTNLDVDGFEQLTVKQKKLSFHLAQAGLWGRFISLDQGSKYNVPLIDTLIKAHHLLSSENMAPYSTLKQEVKDTLFIIFAHNGIYHGTTGKVLDLPLNRDTVQAVIDDLPSVYEKQRNQIAELLKFIEVDVPDYRTVQKKGEVVATSGGNFYENLTQKEVEDWRLANYPQIQEPQLTQEAGETNEAFAQRVKAANAEAMKIPPYGFNARLVKNDDDEIEEQIISSKGLYGAYVKKIIKSLKEAVKYAENSKQRKSIETLIKFYRSGKAEDFDEHCVAWTQDHESDVYFINGLIESYEDPLGIACTFESIVAYKNPLQTITVNKIIKNIQWFEDNMPFESRFKKEEAKGVTASSITVLTMAGDASPSLPLGINLPNSDWIREVYGSKSVNLANSASSRSKFSQSLRQEMYLPEYMAAIEKYAELTNSLHTDLHEIAGHGSGKLLDGVKTDVIGPYYSVLEECRADLVALYFLADEKLKEYGIFNSDVDVKEAALAQYVMYLTNGGFSQLLRVDLGADLTQAHFRNRQTISNWVFKNADKSKVCKIKKDGKTYVQVNDLAYVRELFGKLLAKVQLIKSTGDAKQAADLIEEFGTKVDQELHAEILQRVEKLNMPKVVCFNTPMLTKRAEEVKLVQVEDFFKQQVEMFEQYCKL